MDLLTFVAERYNYWIFITLMMIGLYIVISRGNLIKKLIGLNVFQTSVFIYYISIGKIAGGTAPIYSAEDMEARAHGGEGVEHGALPGKDLLGAGSIHADDRYADGFEQAGNNLEALTSSVAAASHGDPVHSTPSGGANDLHSAPAFDIGGSHASAGDATHSALGVVYSNPLPHVLILTAIVVGIATTAVGLALAVRIREAYGTIEEDELEAADHVAEFGSRPEVGSAAA